MNATWPPPCFRECHVASLGAPWQVSARRYRISRAFVHLGPRSANPTAGVLDASSRVGGSRPSQRTRSSETTRSARGARAASRMSRSPGAASTTTRCQSLRRRVHPVLTRWRVLSMHGRCLFHHNPMAVAPIGIPGFFWGRPGERLVEQARPSPPCLSHSMTFEDLRMAFDGRGAAFRGLR